MNIHRELPTIADTRGIEWWAFWRFRQLAYWSLGSVNPADYWR